MPAQKLVVQNRIGSIVVQADPEATEIKAEAIKTCRATTQANADNGLADILVALTVKHDEPGTVVASVEHPAHTHARRYQVEWRVTAPPDLAVELRSSIGDLECRGFAKPAVLESDLGEITAQALPAGVRARSSLGDVRVEGGGPIDIRTDLGDVQLHLLSGDAGPVSVHSDLGDLHVRVPSDRCGRLVTHTRLGSLRLRLEGITMRMLRQRGQHFDAELAGKTEPAMTLGTGLGDVTVTSYPAETDNSE